MYKCIKSINYKIVIIIQSFRLIIKTLRIKYVLTYKKKNDFKF